MRPTSLPIENGLSSAYSDHCWQLDWALSRCGERHNWLQSPNSHQESHSKINECCSVCWLHAWPSKNMDRWAWDKECRVFAENFQLFVFGSSIWKSHLYSAELHKLKKNCSECCPDMVFQYRVNEGRNLISRWRMLLEYKTTTDQGLWFFFPRQSCTFEFYLFCLFLDFVRSCLIRYLDKRNMSYCFCQSPGESLRQEKQEGRERLGWQYPWLALVVIAMLSSPYVLFSMTPPQHTHTHTESSTFNMYEI